ncbi:MAG: hypothetical protein IJK54_10035 [Clostridia bacterium]|nr:hypothetical protein [Clostridia bacterium]
MKIVIVHSFLPYLRGIDLFHNRSIVGNRLLCVGYHLSFILLMNIFLLRRRLTSRKKTNE